MKQISMSSYGISRWIIKTAEGTAFLTGELHLLSAEGMMESHHWANTRVGTAVGMNHQWDSLKYDEKQDPYTVSKYFPPKYYHRWRRVTWPWRIQETPALTKGPAPTSPEQTDTMYPACLCYPDQQCVTPVCSWQRYQTSPNWRTVAK